MLAFSLAANLYAKHAGLNVLVNPADHSGVYEKKKNIPVNFIWLGSELKPKHHENLRDWLASGVQVVLWYIPEVLDRTDIQRVLGLEKKYEGLLVLDLTRAGLDSLYCNDVSISEELVRMSRLAVTAPRKYRHLYATASNLARMALLVKGQEAIMHAAEGREINKPVFNDSGMIYMDTDIYRHEVQDFYLPEQNLGVHIYKGRDGRLTMNNDVLYAAHPNEAFFRDLLQESLNKIRYQLITGEHLQQAPPGFNGAQFMNSAIRELESFPRIRLQVDPLTTEGNWYLPGD